MDERMSERVRTQESWYQVHTSHNSSGQMEVLFSLPSSFVHEQKLLLSAMNLNTAVENCTESFYSVGPMLPIFCGNDSYHELKV